MQPGPAAEGAELIAEYVNMAMTVFPAGVAYTHPTMGYQTVNLGFGIEFMVGELERGVHYGSGTPDRVDLMANIMEYFGKMPTTTPTGSEGGSGFVNRLEHARPNPFNPTTTIAFSLAAESDVTIRVCDAAGRVVRTLVDSPVAAGPHTATWDGITDTGTRAASGVYFIQMEAAGTGGSFHECRKLVLLK